MTYVQDTDFDSKSILVSLISCIQFQILILIVDFVFQCTSCYGDAELEEESPASKYCHNKSLINRVFSSSRWYYVLTIGFMVNFFIIVFLVVYIYQWRRRHGRHINVSLESPTSGTSTIMSNGHGARKKSWNGSAKVANNNRGYSPVLSSASKDTKLNVPFHDYDSSSDENEELFRK